MKLEERRYIDDGSSPVHCRMSKSEIKYLAPELQMNYRTLQLQVDV